MSRPHPLAPLLAVVALSATTQAQAHDHLIGATPAAGATVAAPRQLVLTFSETMVGHFSGFELARADGQKIAVKVTLGKGGLSLVGAPMPPLAPGTYRVTWHAVSADTHRMEGAYTFTVR